jgi:hypothetical protein
MLRLASEPSVCPYGNQLAGILGSHPLWVLVPALSASSLNPFYWRELRIASIAAPGQPNWEYRQGLGC